MTRLLFVEDDALLREVIAAALALDGFAVRKAGDLDTVGALLQAERFDLILTDLRLGRAAAASLAGLQELRTAARSTPVVLLTGHSEAAHWRPADLGVTAILIKPVALDELLAVVARCCAG